MLELAEVEAFLAVAEELHFGRAAERLRLSPSRVSRLVAQAERRVGGRLFDRSSRRVALTPLGRELHDGLAPAHAELVAVVERARSMAATARSQLWIGYHSLSAVSVGLGERTREFEAKNPECSIGFVETLITDPFTGLRRGEFDVLVTYRSPEPIPGLVVGPLVDEYERVVAVGRGHPLAARPRITAEELARWVCVRPDEDVHPAIGNAVVPPATPSGTPLRFGPRALNVRDVVRLVASGQAVHLTIPQFRGYAQDEPITCVPVPDMPPLRAVLMWRAGDRNPWIRRFAEFAALPLPSERDDG